MTALSVILRSREDCEHPTGRKGRESMIIRGGDNKLKKRELLKCYIQKGRGGEDEGRVGGSR